MDEDAAAAVTRLATWHRRLSTGLRLSFYAVWAAATWSTTLVAGVVPSVGVCVAIYLVAVVPAFRVRVDAVLRTDDPPAAVREQLRTLHNPATWAWTAYADGAGSRADAADGATDDAPEGVASVADTQDERAAVADDDGGAEDRAREVVAVVEVSRLGGLVERTVTLDRVPGPDGDVRFRVRTGDRVFTTIDVAVEPDGDGTRLTSTLRRDRFRPRELATLKLAAPIEARALSHLGYRPVENRVYVGLRGR